MALDYYRYLLLVLLRDLERHSLLILGGAVIVYYLRRIAKALENG